VWSSSGRFISACFLFFFAPRRGSPLQSPPLRGHLLFFFFFFVLPVSRPTFLAIAIVLVSFSCLGFSVLLPGPPILRLLTFFFLGFWRAWKGFFLRPLTVFSRLDPFPDLTCPRPLFLSFSVPVALPSGRVLVRVSSSFFTRAWIVSFFVALQFPLGLPSPPMFPCLHAGSPHV